MYNFLLPVKVLFHRCVFIAGKFATYIDQILLLSEVAAIDPSLFPVEDPKNVNLNGKYCKYTGIFFLRLH